jgi:hypothetical protein
MAKKLNAAILACAWVLQFSLFLAILGPTS